jgi:hypothetical protein
MAKVKARMKNVEITKIQNGKIMLVISKEVIPRRNPKQEIASQFKTPLIRTNPVKK